ncbi:MAG TPA: hypothetical protein VGE79_17900 [Niastella sp.]
MMTHQTTVLKDISKVGEFVSPEKAQEMISAWQRQEPDGVFSFLYGRHVFESILAVPYCEGIRVFNAFMEQGDRQALVLVAVDASGKHILNYPVQTSEGMQLMNAPIMDLGVPCPPFCPLNADPTLDGYSWKHTGSEPLNLEKAGAAITRKEAQQMISAWQIQEPDAVFSFLYGRDIFDSMLSVPGCAGIRIFNGINEEQRQALVFVAVDVKGSNILQYNVITAEGMRITAAPLADGGIPCPPLCPAVDIWGRSF